MHTVTLTDWQGQPHSYEIALFDADTGMKLTFELAGILGGPLGALLKSGLGGMIVGDQPAAQALDRPLADLTAGVDFAAVGQQLAAQIGQADKSLSLVKRLLAITMRDGQRVTAPEVWNGAYQGNYMEALMACVEVIKANRLFPLPATS